MWRSLVLTTAALKSLPTACPCGMERSLRSTRPVSPLTANGVARSLRDPARPIALQEARRRKEAAYPELVGNARCRLVALGAEVGGRWSAEAAEFVRLLVHAKIRAAPAVLRPALRGAYVHRRSGLLAAAASLAFAESLTCLPSPGLSNAFLPCAVMTMVSESNACINAFDDNDTPQLWPQCHRIDASPPRSLQDGFAALLNCWLRRMERDDRLACMQRMGHLSNFLLDIVSVLGVHSLTFGIARLHSLIAYLSTTFALIRRSMLTACWRIANEALQASAWQANTSP